MLVHKMRDGDKICCETLEMGKEDIKKLFPHLSDEVLFFNANMGCGGKKGKKKKGY